MHDVDSGCLLNGIDGLITMPQHVAAPVNRVVLRGLAPVGSLWRHGSIRSCSNLVMVHRPVHPSFSLGYGDEASSSMSDI